MIKKMNGNKVFNRIFGFIIVLLGLVCFLCFQYSYDISHTVSCAYALLYGHISDFYQYCTDHYETINYMPTTYIVFAIWNLLPRIFGVNVDTSMHRPALGIKLLLWNKLLLVVLYVMTAYFIYKICKKLGWGGEKAKTCAIAFLVMPLSFFVQFCLGLYDIITVLFMVLGIYFFFRNKSRYDMFGYIFFFALATTCKSMALLYFFPFLLVKEKKILNIIIKSIGCISIYAAYILIFHKSSAFMEGVLGWGISDLLEYSTIWYLNPAIILTVVAMAMAYFKNITDDNDTTIFANALFYCNIISFAFYGLCLTHPNWIILIVPFIVFSLFLHEKKYAYMWVSVILACVYFIFFSNMPGPHSEALIEAGILGKNGLGVLHPIYALNSFYKLPIARAFTIMSASLLVLAIFSNPKYLNDNSNICENNSLPIKYGYLFGIVAFVIPAFMASMPIGMISGNVFTSYESSYNEVFEVTTEQRITEHIYNEVGTWTNIEIYPITWGNNYSENTIVTMEIFDDESNNTVYNSVLDLNSMTDNSGYCQIDIDSLELEKNSWYRIVFSKIGDSDQQFALKAGPSSALRVGKGYLDVNGECREDWTLLININGK